MKKYLSVAWALLLILALAVGCVPKPAPELLAGAADYNTPCYTPQGGASFTCDSGGGFVVNAGATVTLEGATADAYETTLAVVDPTADRTFTLPDATGYAVVSSLATNAPDAANSISGASNALLFEGATANAYETSVIVIDPTADRTVTIPNETGAVIMSALTTNGTDVANSVTGGTNMLVWEGATADAYETSVSATDPTADRSVVLQDASGTLVLSAGGIDAAGALFFSGQDLKYEGTTADAYEGVLRFPVEPTADYIYVLPSYSGTVMLAAAAHQTVFGSNTITGTLAVTHGLTTPAYVFCALAADSSATGQSCSTVISGSTVTVKVWKPDGITAGSAGLAINWMVVGTP